MKKLAQKTLKQRREERFQAASKRANKRDRAADLDPNNPRDARVLNHRDAVAKKQTLLAGGTPQVETHDDEVMREYDLWAAEQDELNHSILRSNSQDSSIDDVINADDEERYFNSSDDEEGEIIDLNDIEGLVGDDYLIPYIVDEDDLAYVEANYQVVEFS